MAQARSSGAPVEVISARTETSQVFAQPNGRFVLENSLQVQRVRAADGSWLPADPSLHRATDGTLRPAAATVPMSFSGGGSGNAFAAMSSGGNRVALWWPTPLPVPIVSGNLATYPEVLPGVDLEVHASATGFTHVLVVRTPKAAKNPAVRRLTLRAQLNGVSLRKDAATGALSAVDKTGKPVFSGPTPLMWDSRTSVPGADGQEAGSIEPRSAQVAVEVKGTSLTLLPDLKMLDDPATEWPVRIDPTWNHVDGKRNHWTVLRESEPSRSFYDATSVGSGDAASGIVRAGFNDFTGVDIKDRSLFNLDVSAVTYKRIYKATLSLTQRWAGAGCGDTSGTRIVQLRNVNAFGSSTVWNTSWNSQGTGWGSVLAESKAIRRNNESCAPQRVEFLATSAVVNAASKGLTSINLGLRAKNESDKYSWKRYTNDAKLTIEFNTAPNADTAPEVNGKSCPAPGAPILYSTTRTPTLTVLASEFDPGQQQTTSFNTWTDAATRDTAVTSSIGHGPTTTPTRTPTYPTPSLADGTYNLQAQTTDTMDVGGWSPLCRFTVDATPPNVPSGVTFLTVYSGTGSGGGVGIPGTVKLLQPGALASDVAGYAYTLESGVLPVNAQSTKVLNADRSATVTITPTRDGPNLLRVWTFDEAGNYSPMLSPVAFSVTGGSGPATHWRFDASSGADDTGHNLPLTLPAAPNLVTDRWGGTGKALQLNGSSEAATTTWSTATNTSFTVSAWVKLTTSGGTEQRAIIAANGANAAAYTLSYSGPDNKWRFSISGSDITAPTQFSVLSTVTPVVGRWTLVTGVYDGVSTTKTIKLYVNGAQQGSAVTVTSVFNATGGTSVGRRKWSGANAGYFPGAVDEVRIYSFAEAAAKIAALATPLTPTLTVLTAGPYSVGDQVGLRFTNGSDANVATFKYSLGSAVFNQTATAQADGTAQPTVTLPIAGDEYPIYLRALDANNNASADVVIKIKVRPVLAAISGKLYDAETGSPLGGLVVKLDPLSLTTTSAVDGAFQFAGIANGNYMLSATADDRCAMSGATAITVSGDTQLDVYLTPLRDSAGYSCGSQTIAFPSGTTAVSLTGDNAIMQQALPFSMWFYGKTYSSIWIDTNGLLSFENQSASHPSPTQVPNPDGLDALIAPFWDDLVIDGTGSVRTASAGTAPNRTFTVEWRDAHRSGETDRFSVAVTLSENATVTTYYTGLGTDSEKGLFATVGIESAGGEIGIQYSYQATGLADGAAVVFTAPEDRPAAVESTVSGTVTDSGSGTPVAGITVHLDPVGMTTTTNAQGTYSFGNLEPGGYTVSAADGPRCARFGDTYVSLAGTTDVDLQVGLLPDAVGYTCQAKPVTFTPADQTILALTGDDVSQQVTPPFPLSLYGGSYTNAWINSNGWLSFIQPCGYAAEPNELPKWYSCDQPDAAVYAFWNDWIVDGQASVRTATLGTAPSRRFVVEWRNVRDFNDSNARVSFEIVFYEADGGIDLAWNDIDSNPIEQGSTGAVAIEDAEGEIALVHSFKEAILASGQGVAFRPGSPGQGSLAGVVTCNGVPAVGVDVSVGGQSVTTGVGGTYSFNDLVVGEYALVGTAASGTCAGSTSVPVLVTQDSTETVNVELELAVAPVHYTVTRGARALSTTATTPLALTGDDTLVEFTLPFPVTLYGQTYTQAWICANGVVTFTEPGAGVWNVSPIPKPSPLGGDDRADAAVYPFWNDWVLDEFSSVYTGVSGAPGSRQFVVQWRNAGEYDASHLRVDFEVVFFESNGDIAVAWDGIGGTYTERGGNGLVGVENEDGTVAMQYSYRHPVIASGQGLLFHPVA